LGAFDWYEKAACRGLDVELFYAEEPASTAQALRICASCEVRVLCHDTAMSEREAFGVWGGTPEQHRRRIFRREDRLRRRQQRAA
jgi:WhiB family redox-sensing transcriptional regulator